ncbi:MAG: NUDIX domain-containing protein [Clostridia bacterium]|nr:NUDIX domain-containing protein [Clostridia bacterium]
MLEKSCGTIPYTIKDGCVYYLLIKAEDNGTCGFPKGHVEEGESEAETALRETWEETSIKPVIKKGFRYEISYPLQNGNEKTVVYFLAEFQNQVPTRNAGFEKYAYLLLPFEKATVSLSFESARLMLKTANDFLTNRNTFM